MKINAITTEEGRSIQVIEGLLKGIAADNEINMHEVKSLKEWLDNHSHFRDMYPYADLYDIISKIFAEKRVSKYLQSELLDFCNSFYVKDGVYDSFTSEMRILHGYISGIMADGVINIKELEVFNNWLDVHNKFSNRWPYSEIAELIHNVLRDGKIDNSEHGKMMNIFGDFIEKKISDNYIDDSISDGSWMKSEAPVVKSVSSIFENVNIVLNAKAFCFTGQANLKRKDLREMLENSGGIFKNGVSHQIDYLVIGNKSNPAWVYATYGRKIEAVMNLKKEGYSISIINESQFVQAVDFLK